MRRFRWRCESTSLNFKKKVENVPDGVQEPPESKDFWKLKSSASRGKLGQNPEKERTKQRS